MSRRLLAVGVGLVAVIGLTAWMAIVRRDRAVDVSTPDPAVLIESVRACLPPPVEPRTEATGFVVGGTNSTALIRTLTAINGRAIAHLEADMRPGAPPPFGSTKGFLGPDESLLDVLATDNETVTTELSLTHQVIGRELNAIGAVVKAGAAYRHRHPVEFVYRGRRFRGVMSFWKGEQLSPFGDGTDTSNDLDLDNLDTGKTLRLSLLVPLMIERYGFYEGHGTPYRVDPRQVVEVLDFLKPAK